MFCLLLEVCARLPSTFSLKKKKKTIAQLLSHCINTGRQQTITVVIIVIKRQKRTSSGIDNSTSKKKKDLSFFSSVKTAVVVSKKEEKRKCGTRKGERGKGKRLSDDEHRIIPTLLSLSLTIYVRMRTAFVDGG